MAEKGGGDGRDSGEGGDWVLRVMRLTGGRIGSSLTIGGVGVDEEEVEASGAAAAGVEGRWRIVAGGYSLRWAWVRTWPRLP